MSDLVRYKGYVVDGRRLARTRVVSVSEEDERGDSLPDRHYMTHSAGSTDIHYCCTIPGEVTCDCGDFQWQNHPYGESEELYCKHLLASLLYEDVEGVNKQARKIGVA